MTLSFVVVWSLLAAPPPPADPIDAAALWEHRCQTCHGADGRAHTRMGQREDIDDFTNPSWQAASSDAHLRDTIREGSRGNLKMKPFKDLLSPEEIDALVAYIRRFGVRQSDAGE